MRIVPIVSVMILVLSANIAFARRSSRCRHVECECAPVVCSSASACATPTTVCGTPQPTVIALAETAFPVAPLTPANEAPLSAKRPKPVSKRIAPNADPTLDAYLAEWETASSKIHRLDCEFVKFTYDPTFEIERRGQGTIAVERDHQAKYRVVPVVIKPGDVSGKKRKDGIPYRLEPCSPECWHWTGREAYKIDEPRHIYEKIPLPLIKGFDPSSNHALPEVPLAKPFLIAMPAEKLKKRYKVKQLKDTDEELWLEIIPRHSAETANFEKAVLILDRQKWVARAMRLYDPAGGFTTFMFQNVKVNSETAEDLSKPNVDGYRQIMANETTKTESSK